MRFYTRTGGGQPRFLVAEAPVGIGCIANLSN